ncbi:Tetratricopeptide-like helical [Metarhizium album ARSEF 1941]|uniref:Tetratricopeptide-like helical n=1 Tax=Metarhizium album (strain ARSEF 1941) TaxID=1081103 RepID=A0A0B2WU84_METAS|nr:Tetratricopeptide-like helical [Metarhizium album ARSEF 1941]KHN99631.1 Tetratricopeptide-like helical [Metarhizium album ARSEF 1941]
MNPKAANYIEQLNSARCEGNWDAVPELVRKVRKHAPERQCLALAAETECAISQATLAGARPSAAQTARDLDVPTLFPKLAAAIDDEQHHHEDRFQAKVCMGWLHWVVGEYNDAMAILPGSLEAEGISEERMDTVSEWTNLSALKSAYLKANCFMRNDQGPEALSALRTGTPSLNGVWCGHGVRKQLRYWSELFLTEYCMLSSQAVEKEELDLDDPDALASFRAWARYWDVMGAPITGGFGFKGSVPRRRIWAEYYEALSRILENDLSYAGGPVDTISADSSARAQLRLETKKVEAAYRALILTETTFPKADEDREEVEDFVKRVMTNWSILCGRGWREQDLGEGGRAAMSRNVLETLYSAATRTYHSTTILRSLFRVHLALAEFDLAFKALDSYLEIVHKAKARVEKTGHREAGLDDDGAVLETMAQAIIALCRYGRRNAGERARQLGAELEDQLSKMSHTRSAENGAPTNGDTEPRSEWRTHVAPNVVALAWQAIGLSHAHWARITHEAASITEIQSKAIRCLRKSLAAEFGRSKDIRSFFSLALLLAERRELTAAIELVRSALLCNKGNEESYSLFHGPYWQERTLIPVWHLLALLLSARQDYALAARACEGALDQFKDSTILFGKSSAHSDHLKDPGAHKTAETPVRGLVDDMDGSEKESILEVKMTQLALIEVVEGPDAAVNASHELLSLFSRLFGSPSTASPVALPAPSLPPETSGTIRGIRGSIFGGGKADKSSPPARQHTISAVGEKSAVATSRPATSHSSHTAAPASQGFDEKDTINGSRRGGSGPGRGSNSRRRNSLKKRDRSGSRTRPVPAAATIHQPTMVDGETFFTPTGEVDSPDFFNLNKLSAVQPPSSSRGKPMSSMHSIMSATSKSSDVTELNVDVTHASPNVLPLVQFSKMEEKGQKISLLIKIWLTIAGFYRRAGMLDDGKAAVLEAQKLLVGIESEAARDPSSTGAAKGDGWGEMRSSDDLWGDIWSELGLLGIARGLPYEAKSDFEVALTHSADHATAIVGLSNVLLDIYSEKVLPPPNMPSLDGLSQSEKGPFQSCNQGLRERFAGTLPSWPLGLGPFMDDGVASPTPGKAAARSEHEQLPVSYKAAHLPLVDRLAARERAFTLLSGLTRLGTGWDNSDAWFALARAHEESGQPEKAKEVLWWCVELEEAMGVRDWRCVGNGGYFI